MQDRCVLVAPGGALLHQSTRGLLLRLPDISVVALIHRSKRCLLVIRVATVGIASFGSPLGRRDIPLPQALVVLGSYLAIIPPDELQERSEPVRILCGQKLRVITMHFQEQYGLRAEGRLKKKRVNPYTGNVAHGHVLLEHNYNMQDVGDFG